MKNQNIECSVYDCKHCNEIWECCSLKEIKVCSCGCECKKEATMCYNYEKK